MGVPDAILGKIILIAVFTLFAYFVIWITILPFTELDEDHWLYKGFFNRNIGLLLSSIWGVAFVGSLMTFTFYQVYPFL